MALCPNCGHPLVPPPGLGIADGRGKAKYGVWQQEPEYAPRTFTEHQVPSKGAGKAQRDEEE